MRYVLTVLYVLGSMAIIATVTWGLMPPLPAPLGY